MKIIKIIGVLAVILIIILAIVSSRKNIKENSVALEDQTPVSIIGCYVANISKDVYKLKIDSEAGGVIEGSLSFNNFEKDSSSGTFSGTFKNDILIGDYSFDSEGMHSVRQVAFNRVGDSFVEGFGDVEMVGDREVFKDLNDIAYSPKLTFVKSDSCSEEVE